MLRLYGNNFYENLSVVLINITSDAGIRLYWVDIILRTITNNINTNIFTTNYL